MGNSTRHIYLKSLLSHTNGRLTKLVTVGNMGYDDKKQHVINLLDVHWHLK